MNRIRWTVVFVAVLMSVQPGDASAADFANQAFKIQYDDSGIRSLKRTNDIHDTEYLAANGILGSLVVRYRSTPNGDWRIS